MKKDKSKDLKLIHVQNQIAQLKKLDAICILLDNSEAYALLYEVENIQRSILCDILKYKDSVNLSVADIEFIKFKIQVL